MLVHFPAGDLRKRHYLTGAQHGLGQRGYFRAAQPANPRGHQPGGHLVIGNFAAGVSGNQEVDFLPGMFSRIALFADKVDGSHGFRANRSLTPEQRSVKEHVPDGTPPPGPSESYRGGASSASNVASCSSQTMDGVCRRRTQRFQRRIESSLPAGRIFSASPKQSSARRNSG